MVVLTTIAFAVTRGPPDVPTLVLGRASQLTSDPGLEVQPSMSPDGRHVVAGFTNRSLRAQVSHLLGVPYTVGQMSYDLVRLRLNGLMLPEASDAPHTAA